MWYDPSYVQFSVVVFNGSKIDVTRKIRSIFIRSQGESDSVSISMTCAISQTRRFSESYSHRVFRRKYSRQLSHLSCRNLRCRCEIICIEMSLLKTAYSFMYDFILCVCSKLMCLTWFDWPVSEIWNRNFEKYRPAFMQHLFFGVNCFNT
jgi:hypothetical protein